MADYYHRKKSNMPLVARKNFIWAFGNFVRGKPAPNINQVRCSIKIFIDEFQIAMSRNDKEFIKDCCWPLSYISESIDLRILYENGVLKNAIDLLTHTDYTVIIVALRIVGNFLSEDSSAYDQEIINMGIVSKIKPLTKNVNRNLRKEAFWILSNISASSCDRFQKIIDDRELVNMITSTILCNQETLVSFPFNLLLTWCRS